MWKAGDAYLEVDVYPGKDLVFVEVTDGHRIFLRGDMTFKKMEELQDKIKEMKKDDNIIKIAEQFGLTAPVR